MKHLRHSIITAMLLAATALPASATTGCAATGWSDMHVDIYGCTLYYPAIAYLYDQGVVEGSPAPVPPYGEGRRVYRPFDTVNRAEFTKIILGATNRTAEGCSEKPFPDVPTEEWYGRYVCAAKDAGLIAGYPDGLFRPEQSVNFAEAAKIIIRAFDLPFDPADAQFDQDQYVWYRPYTEALRGKNAIAPSITAHDKHVTRGEMAEMAYRLMTGKTSADPVSEEEFENVEEMAGYGKGLRDAEYNADLVGAAGEYFYFTGLPEELQAAFPTTQTLQYFPGLSGTAKGFRFVHAAQHERCSLSGLAEHCTPLTYDIDIGLYNLPLDSGIVRRAIVEYAGGEDVVTERNVGSQPIIGTCVQLGVEGENVDYCSVPLGYAHTLLVVRHWIDTNVMMMPIMSTAEQNRIFMEFLNRIEVSMTVSTESTGDTSTLILGFAIAGAGEANGSPGFTRIIPKTSRIADAHIRALLGGPTAEEELQGAMGIFSEEFSRLALASYRSVTIVDGTAVITFDAEKSGSFASIKRDNLVGFFEGIHASLNGQFPNILHTRFLAGETVLAEI